MSISARTSEGVLFSCVEVCPHPLLTMGPSTWVNGACEGREAGPRDRDIGKAADDPAAGLYDDFLGAVVARGQNHHELMKQR